MFAMTRRLLGALTFAAIMAAAGGLMDSTAVRASGPCDDPAGYPDTLCAGGHLNANGYLSSPNGRYRFVYQGDGNTVIYDTFDWNNWDPSVSIFEPHANAGYLMYGVDGAGRASTAVTMWSFTPWNTSALPYYVDWGQAQSTGHYMKLENDGCLRAYQVDGSPITTLWC
jgi:hypothetical protein